VQNGKVLATGAWLPKKEKDPPLRKDYTNSLGMEFVLVPKGKSWLGGGGGKPGDKEVEIAHDFYLGKYEVTQEEWEKVAGLNPSEYKAVLGVAKEDQMRFPVEQVSWEDAQAFIERLNKMKIKEAGWVYRLPKEAEWEYACRGGPLGDRLDSAFDFYFEKPTNQLLPEQANFNQVLKRTCKVGSYKPNRLGLYDMHGNVWEWCEDLYDPKEAGASPRVSRGGCWINDSGHCRAAYRNAHPPSPRIISLGLRVARVPVGKEIVKIVPAEKKPADPVTRDFEKLQGNWLLVAWEVNGKKTPEEKVKDTRLTITGDNYRVVSGMGDMLEAGTIKLDPTKKPKAVDSIISLGAHKGKTRLGIYEVEDDQGKFCYAAPGKERPQDFTTRPASGHSLWIWKRIKPAPKTFNNSLGMEFVLVPKGKSWLGGGGGWPGTKEVEIAHDFYLGKYEVTQGEWEKVMGTNPSAFKALPGVAKEDQKRFPVEQVSWEDAHLFLKELNRRDKEAGWVYRLPREGEWEYACRGGPTNDKSESAFDFYFEKPTNQLLTEQANFEDGKGLKRTCKVGSYRPNRLGLYDMHGNVMEWCEDLYAPKDPPRVNRGGGWIYDSGSCRAALRHGYPPSYRLNYLGLRLARVPIGKEIIKIAPEEKKSPVEAKLPPTFTNDLGMEFVLVPKGKSWLGGGAGKPGTKEVEIAHDFYLGKYEVTQGEWEKITGLNPSIFKAVPGVSKEDQKRFPVENVSWNDAQAFIERLNKREKQAGWVYRLPKETEWEYACRGGPLSSKAEAGFDYYLDKPANELLPDHANFDPDKGIKRTCKVGSYKPNPLGLYDMHGNVMEWCEDAVNSGVAVPERVIRGGGFNSSSWRSKAAYHGWLRPTWRDSPSACAWPEFPSARRLSRLQRRRRNRRWKPSRRRRSRTAWA